MVPKLISKNVAGILILGVVMGAMAWQAAPVSAGFTPTPTETSVPTIAPTATETSIPTIVPTPTATTVRRTRVPPTETLPATPAITPTVTPPPLLPRTGGQASASSNTDLSAVSLAAVLVLVVTAISLVVRASARTRIG